MKKCFSILLAGLLILALLFSIGWGLFVENRPEKEPVPTPTLNYNLYLGPEYGWGDEVFILSDKIEALRPIGNWEFNQIQYMIQASEELGIPYNIEAGTYPCGTENEVCESTGHLKFFIRSTDGEGFWNKVCELNKELFEVLCR